MGWLFGYHSRKSLIDHLVRGNGVVTHAYCLKGNNLWAVQAWQGKKFIALYLLRGNKHSTYNWGYKDMDEGMGPYYYNCPLSYLDMADEPSNDSAREWRAKVREWHAEQKQKIQPGAHIQYGCHKYEVIKKLSHGYEVYEPNSMTYFAMKSSQIKEARLWEPPQ